MSLLAETLYALHPAAYWICGESLDGGYLQTYSDLPNYILWPQKPQGEGIAYTQESPSNASVKLASGAYFLTSDFPLSDPLPASWWLFGCVRMVGSSGTLLSLGSDPAGAEIRVGVGASGELRVWVLNSSGTQVATAGGGTVTNGWHDWAVVYASGVLRVYLDGSQIASVAATLPALSLNRLAVGASYRGSATLPASAYISHVACGVGSLSAAQVLQAHNSVGIDYIGLDPINDDFSTIESYLAIIHDVAWSGTLQGQLRGLSGYTWDFGGGTIDETFVPSLRLQVVRGRHEVSSLSGPGIVWTSGQIAVFKASGTVSLDGLQFVNGNVFADLIDAQGLSLVIENCQFQWSQAGEATPIRLQLTGWSGSCSASAKIRNNSFYQQSSDSVPSLLAATAIEQGGNPTLNVSIDNNSALCGLGSIPYGIRLLAQRGSGTATIAGSVRNNAIFGPASCYSSAGEGTITLTASNNAASDGTAGLWGSSGAQPNQAAASWFVSPTSDCTLKSGSPGVDGGVALADFATDWAGTPRPRGSAWDCGCVESPQTNARPGAAVAQAVAVAPPIVRPLTAAAGSARANALATPPGTSLGAVSRTPGAAQAAATASSPAIVAGAIGRTPAAATAAAVAAAPGQSLGTVNRIPEAAGAKAIASGPGTGTGPVATVPGTASATATGTAPGQAKGTISLAAGAATATTSAAAPAASGGSVSQAAGAAQGLARAETAAASVGTSSQAAGAASAAGAVQPAGTSLGSVSRAAGVASAVAGAASSGVSVNSTAVVAPMGRAGAVAVEPFATVASMVIPGAAQAIASGSAPAASVSGQGGASPEAAQASASATMPGVAVSEIAVSVGVATAVAGGVAPLRNSGSIIREVGAAVGVGEAQAPQAAESPVSVPAGVASASVVASRPSIEGGPGIAEMPAAIAAGQVASPSVSMTAISRVAGAAEGLAQAAAPRGAAGTVNGSAGAAEAQAFAAPAAVSVGGTTQAAGVATAHAGTIPAEADAAAVSATPGVATGLATASGPIYAGPPVGHLTALILVSPRLKARVRTRAVVAA